MPSPRCVMAMARWLNACVGRTAVRRGLRGGFPVNTHPDRRPAKRPTPEGGPMTEQQPPSLSKEQIVSQLQKEGVTDLDSLADLIVRKSHQDGDPDKPITNGVIIYHHGFVTH